MIDRYAKCLMLVILAGWIIGTRECAAATPFTPRHADPVQEFWCWRAFPELKGQGLSCLAQDRDGNFLFGTDNGIHRYDGTTWRVFPLDEGIVGTRINTLYVARDGISGHSFRVGTAQPLLRTKPQCHSFKPLVDGKTQECRPDTPRKRNSRTGLSLPSWASR